MTIQVQIQQGIAPECKGNWNPDLDGSFKKGCIHDGRVKNDHHPLPKNSRMPEIPLSKVQRALKCEFCWSEVLRR